ncbi:hypothetical protein HUG17_0568 [Dermatophagoides farinae]|uniref:Uncharacterized protein n=1 Tax=Dermatophagoides farinae TaxID=6954 RepID=A0A9D4P5C3_DERFA|nr:hypothetical protein HUG17_0568 [Dermatophagoides farinae]
MVQCPMKHHVHHQVTLEFRYQSMILTLTFLKGLNWIGLLEQLFAIENIIISRRFIGWNTYLKVIMDRRRTIEKLNLEPRIEFGHCLVTWTANIGSISNDHGSPANNWEIESRTTDRIWTLSCNMDREYWIYFK